MEVVALRADDFAEDDRVYFRFVGDAELEVPPAPVVPQIEHRSQRQTQPILAHAGYLHRLS